VCEGESVGGDVGCWCGDAGWCPRAATHAPRHVVRPPDAHEASASALARRHATHAAHTSLGIAHMSKSQQPPRSRDAPPCVHLRPGPRKPRRTRSRSVLRRMGCASPMQRPARCAPRLIPHPRRSAHHRPPAHVPAPRARTAPHTRTHTSNSRTHSRCGRASLPHHAFSAASRMSRIASCSCSAKPAESRPYVITSVRQPTSRMP